MNQLVATFLPPRVLPKLDLREGGIPEEFRTAVVTPTLFGSVEGLPNDPDGIFLPPPAPRCFELMVKQASDRLKFTCIPCRL